MPNIFDGSRSLSRNIGYRRRYSRLDKEIKKSFYFVYRSLSRNIGYRRRYSRSDKEIKKCFYFVYLSLIRIFVPRNKRLYLFIKWQKNIILEK